jgi:hypothetical protein
MMQFARLRASFAASEKDAGRCQSVKKPKKALRFSRIVRNVSCASLETVPPHRAKSREILFCPIGSRSFASRSAFATNLWCSCRWVWSDVFPALYKNDEATLGLGWNFQTTKLDFRKSRQLSPFLLTVGAVGARSVRRCRRGPTVGVAGAPSRRLTLPAGPSRGMTVSSRRTAPQQRASR